MRSKFDIFEKLENTLRKHLAVLILCVICLLGTYLTVQSAYDSYGPNFDSTSPYLVIGVSIALFVTLRMGRVHQFKQRVAIGMLISTVLLGSYQVFNYQAYLHRTWQTIVAALKQGHTPGIRTQYDSIQNRWGGIVTETTTEEQAVSLITNAIYESTGQTGIVGLLIHKAQWGIFEDYTFRRGWVGIPVTTTLFWEQTIFPSLLTIGCLVTVAIFSEKRKFKRKRMTPKFDFRRLLNIEPSWSEVDTHQSTPQKNMRYIHEYTALDIRHRTEEDMPYSL